MKLSEKWLREWVSPSVDAEAIAEQLTMAGLEVDGIEPAAPAFSNVVVGRVLAVEPHPNADRLRVCRVQAGSGDALTIVCGAANVRPGMLVPTALAGAELPGGLSIRKSAVRGVESAGMLCSAKELGLLDSADGLLELPSDAVPGTNLRVYLDLDDRMLVMELTPNRGDCLSVMGVAREVGVLNRLPLTGPTMRAVPARSGLRQEIRIDAADACPHYAGRIVTHLNPKASTPLWMRERLRRSGIRCIHPFVDVTNYVMLELGQPMHAFDHAKLWGAVHVRMAMAGETLALLDGQSVDLRADTLVIADDSGPIAMAGVMGGAASAVTETTSAVFLESASFSPRAVAGQGRHYKIHTDSLHRFERGVDPELQVRALERATALLQEIAGGEPGPVVSMRTDTGRKPVTIRLRHDRLRRLLGAEIKAEEVTDILRHLGLKVEMSGQGEWRLRAPSYRYDLAIEADLIEEVARIHGYSCLPARHQQVQLPPIPDSETRLSPAKLRDTLIQRGYQEAITYSFVDPGLQAALTPDLQAIDLDNPIASQLAQMRTTLWSGLLPAWVHNLQRQQTRIRLFELGMRFYRNPSEKTGISQEPMLSGLIAGAALPEQWGSPARAADFYDLKADVEALLSLGGMPQSFSFEPASHPALHPGQSAQIVCGGEVVGWFGRAHPGLAAVLDVKEELPLLFELRLPAVLAARIPAHRSLSEFPHVRRDLAFVVPEQVHAGSIVSSIKKLGDPLLRDILVFDVYRGQGLQSGCKSIALGLIFQEYSRTLTDTEVDQSITRMQAHLQQELGATVRG